MIKRTTISGLALLFLLPIGCENVQWGLPEEYGGSGVQTTAPTNTSFQITSEYQIAVPAEAQRVQAWIPLASERDDSQNVSDLQIDGPATYQKVEDDYGNDYAYFDLEAPEEAVLIINQTFSLSRSESLNKVSPRSTQALSEEDRAVMAQYLRPGTYVTIDDTIRNQAKQIIGEETNPVLAAREIYRWCVANLENPGKRGATTRSPMGNTRYALSNKTGSSLDIHSLYVSLTRASGIPARLVHGALLNPSLDGSGLHIGTHSWAEFYANGLGWIPVDVAVGDVYDGEVAITNSNRNSIIRSTATGYTKPSKKQVDYYFGSLDARRLTWNRGRDIVMKDPTQGGNPINAMNKPYVEIDGVSVSNWTGKVTFSSGGTVIEQANP
ncbi:MAG: transglutaminase family protein [Verrucomicrobiota bacterium]